MQGQSSNLKALGKAFGFMALANIALYTVAAHADQATYLGKDASYCEIFQAINPDVPEDCYQELGLQEADGSEVTRSIRIHEPTQTVQPASHDTAPVQTASAAQGGADDNYAIAMRVPFHFDSDKLTAEAKSILDRVAQVLNSELMSGNEILIEGHADATGGESYNLTLSTRRALAVQAYLTEEHMIAMDRLPATGLGEAEPYDPASPKASVNRRVEFMNLGS